MKQPPNLPAVASRYEERFAKAADLRKAEADAAHLASGDRGPAPSALAVLRDRELPPEIYRAIVGARVVLGNATTLEARYAESDRLEPLREEIRQLIATKGDRFAPLLSLLLPSSFPAPSIKSSVGGDPSVSISQIQLPSPAPAYTASQPYRRGSGEDPAPTLNPERYISSVTPRKVSEYDADRPYGKAASGAVAALALKNRGLSLLVDERLPIGIRGELLKARRIVEHAEPGQRERLAAVSLAAIDGLRKFVGADDMAALRVAITG